MSFEEIQKNWLRQQAPAAEAKAGGATAESDLLVHVKVLQRKVMRTNLMVAILISLTAVAFVFIFRPLLNPKTIWYDVGMGLTLGAAFALGLLHWFKSMPWKKKISLSSKEYVEQVLKNVRYLNAANQKLIPFFMVAILTGINLIYFHIFWKENLKLRLVMHIMLNAFMITVGAISQYSSKHHNDQSYEPIIQELEELQHKLEEV